MAKGKQDGEIQQRSRLPPTPAGHGGLSVVQRYRFLAEASRELASSLDYEETLAGVAGRPLPFLDAWCIVDLVEGENRMRRVAIVHPDPEKRHLADQLRAGWPPSRDDPFGVPTVMRSRKPELVSEVTDELLVTVGRDDENLRILRELRMGSLVTVPMLARGRLIGAITYVAPQAGRTFSAEDVALASDLAALSALAVENARLHEEAQAATKETESRRAAAERLTTLAGRLNEKLLLSAVKEMDAAEQAESTEEAKAEFMASFSHELRTPLSAISAYAELLVGGHYGPLTETQISILKRIHRAVYQVLHLVDQILTHARLGAGREPIQVEPVDVAAVANEVLALMEPSAAKKGLRLLPDMPRETLVLRTDGDKVRQILLNLLSNAVKFTDEGEVRLTVRPQAGGALLEVKDTGRGISPEDRERIFERFLQAEGPPSLTSRGSGLGLAITSALIDLLGGELGLESEPGHGSTFIVRLPSLGTSPGANREE